MKKTLTLIIAATMGLSSAAFSADTSEMTPPDARNSAMNSSATPSSASSATDKNTLSANKSEMT